MKQKYDVRQCILFVTFSNHFTDDDSHCPRQVRYGNDYV